MRFSEKVSRSLVKAITFRIMVVIFDFFIIYAITHRYDLTIGLIMVFNFSHTIVYIIHERVWNKIHWGKHHLS